MTPKTIVILLVGLTLASVHLAEAQQGKIPRIGILTPDPIPARADLFEAFRQGLRELGYVEGRNIAIEWGSAEGRFDRLPAVAAELVGLNVDVIVATGGTVPAQAAKNVTRTIPVVFTSVGDPVGAGLVASLARPGGNVTGLSRVGPDLSVKKLELLKEVVPKISRVALISNPANPSNLLSMRETEVAARAFRVQLQSLEVRGPNDLEPAFSAIKKERAGALIVQADPIFRSERARLAELAVKNFNFLALPVAAVEKILHLQSKMSGIPI
jgi:putative tryptophan/tyrosine transport system substrate-binding protein